MPGPNSRYETPAIVVGGGLNALGVVRSLGAAGVPVRVLDTDSRSSAMRSRWGRAQVVPTVEGAAFMAELQRIVAPLGPRVVLFLTEEKAVNTVSELRASLPASVLIRLPEHQRLMQLMHKQGFQELAEAMAAPVPRTVRLQSSQDLPLVRALNFPCVLKPSEKSYAYGARFKKAYKVASADEVDALYREIEPVLADMVVQEWIEGGDGDIYFCLQYIGGQGEVVSSFAGRKIRSWPPRIGGTASCTAAWEHAQELSDRHGQHGIQARCARRALLHGGAHRGAHRFPGRSGHPQRLQPPIGGVLPRAGFARARREPRQPAPHLARISDRSLVPARQW